MNNRLTDNYLISAFAFLIRNLRQASFSHGSESNDNYSYFVFSSLLLSRGMANTSEKINRRITWVIARIAGSVNRAGRETENAKRDTANRIRWKETSGQGIAIATSLTRGLSTAMPILPGNFPRCNLPYAARINL